MTPLHTAPFSGAVRACSRLWLLGTDLDAKNEENQTPLEVAVDSRQDAKVAFLNKLTTASNVDAPTPKEWGFEILAAMEAGKKPTDETARTARAVAEV